MFRNHTRSKTHDIAHYTSRAYAGSLIASVTDNQYLTITLITVYHGSVPYTHVDVSNSGSAG